MIMKKNIGKIDKILRVIVGLIIGGLGIYYKSWWGLIGIVPVFTALMSFCPIYPAFKISTKKGEESKVK